MLVIQSVFNRDGTIIATASHDVRLWDSTTGELVAEYDGPGITSFNCLAFGVGSMIAFGDFGNDITLWDINKDAAQPPLEGHTDSLYSLAFFPPTVDI